MKKWNTLIKAVESLKDSGSLLKRVSKAIKNEAEEQKGGFLGILLGKLDEKILGNMLAGKGIVIAGYESSKNKNF